MSAHFLVGYFSARGGPDLTSGRTVFEMGQAARSVEGCLPSHGNACQSVMYVWVITSQT